MRARVPSLLQQRARAWLSSPNNPRVGDLVPGPLRDPPRLVDGRAPIDAALKGVSLPRVVLATGVLAFTFFLLRQVALRHSSDSALLGLRTLAVNTGIPTVPSRT